MTVQPGTRLGPYEIVTPIGSGGMGEVYRANDTRLDRTVAIKIVSPLLAGQSGAPPALRARGPRGLEPESPAHLHAL